MRSKRVFLLEMMQYTSKAKEAILERFRGLLEGVSIIGYRPGI